MSRYPSVYPSDIKYRAGRIQSLNSEQEIILKQCWATLLRYWGYELDLSAEDIRNKQAFVCSSVVEQVKNENTEAEKATKKKRSLFSRKPLETSAPVEVSESRRKELENNAREYQEVTPSRNTLEIYTGHLIGNGEDSDSADSSENDSVSIESFQTATKSLEETSTGSTDEQSEQCKSKYTKPIPKPASPELSLFQSMLNYNPTDIHDCFFGVIKNDLIDNFLLRFIRARKNNHKETMDMLLKSLDWRKNDVEVETLLREGDAPAVVNGDHPGFVKNFMVNKAFVRGQDRNKNPLFIFQSRKHFAADSSLAGTERYALLIIEWCRLFLREVNESVDSCSLVFDLSGFSMKNADNAPVKFLTSIFEAHYPESLGIVIVHNAPWIFSTVWNIIKNWLDPVVASKIHFTKSYKDLENYIEPQFIPEYLGGDDLKPLVYPKPGPEHATPMKEKDADYHKIVKAREQLILQIIETTKEWICATSPEVSSKYLKEKIYLSYQLSDNYIALDPYLRNPGVYDRDRTLHIKN